MWVGERPQRGKASAKACAVPGPGAQKRVIGSGTTHAGRGVSKNARTAAPLTNIKASACGQWARQCRNSWSSSGATVLMRGKATAAMPWAAKSLTHACACSAGRVTTKSGRGSTPSNSPSATRAQRLGHRQAQGLGLSQGLNLAALVHAHHGAGFFRVAPRSVQAQLTWGLPIGVGR